MAFVEYYADALSNYRVTTFRAATCQLATIGKNGQKYSEPKLGVFHRVLGFRNLRKSAHILNISFFLNHDH